MEFLKALFFIVILVLSIKYVKIVENLSEQEYEDEKEKRKKEYEELENDISVLNDEIVSYENDIKNEESKIIEKKMEQLEQSGKVFSSKNTLKKLYERIKNEIKRIKL